RLAYPHPSPALFPSTPPPVSYPLSLHDALPICEVITANLRAVRPAERDARWLADPEHSRRIARQIAGGLAKTLEALPDEDVRVRSEEHTSELQSHLNLVCRLLLEKKNKK